MNISYIPSEMGGDPLSNIASPPRLEERERKEMKLDDFLKRAENLQLEEKGRTLPIMQIAIMFETWSAGDSVPVSDVIEKYEVPKYLVFSTHLPRRSIRKLYGDD